MHAIEYERGEQKRAACIQVRQEPGHISKVKTASQGENICRPAIDHKDFGGFDDPEGLRILIASNAPMPVSNMVDEWRGGYEKCTIHPHHTPTPAPQ